MLPGPDKGPGWKEPGSSAGRGTSPPSPICTRRLTRLLAEGDKVAVRFTVEGTQQGALLGIPPAGKHFRISDIGIYRLAEGKIAENWEQADMLGLMQQLGLLAPPG